MRRAPRTDANQPDIVDGLRAIGCSVQPLTAVGDGCPDLLVGTAGQNVLIEVKVPGKKLNSMQKPWHRDWKGKAHVVWSLVEAIQVVQHYSKNGAGR